MAPRIVLSATTDLTYDQRMARTSTALAAAGYAVLLVGRTLPDSRPLAPDRPYAQHRLHCYFHRGKLFYLEFTLRLAWFLLRHRAPAVYGAVDLDTVLPVWLAARLKRRPWVYDAHELFTEVPEVVARPAIQRLWRRIEAFAVPRATRAYTVGPALADVFRRRYGRPFGVVRNVPEHQTGQPGGGSAAAPAPTTPPVILYQGALNVGRGLEALLDAMPLLSVAARLVICGEGDLSKALRARVAADAVLAACVEFRGYVVPAELRVLTRRARVGVMLLENTGLSYYYSLANKFFDYVHAGVPQVCIDFPEYRALNHEYEVALLVPDLAPAGLAAALSRVLADEAYHAQLAATCARAARAWNWERESAVVAQIFGEATAAGTQ